MQPSQDLAVIRAQPRPGDFACFLIDGMRHDRKCVHIQSNADPKIFTPTGRPQGQIGSYPEQSPEASCSANVALPARVFTHAGNPRIVLQHEAFGLS
jgi:hypothetical protein